MNPPSKTYPIPMLMLMAVGILLVSTGCKSMPGFGGNGATNTLGTSDWLESYEEAQKMSEDSGKPILVNFTGSDWCTWCQMLKREVFDKDQFKSWATENVVLLELDFPHNRLQGSEITTQNSRLAKKLNVKSYPTVMLLDSNGTPIGEKFGYIKGGPSAWIAEAQSQLR